MAFIKANSAEGGSNGTTLSAANSGGASGSAFSTVSIGTNAAITFDNTRAYNGTFSYKFVTTTTPGDFFGKWSGLTAQADYWTRAYFYFASNPGSATGLFLFYSGGTWRAGIGVDTAGKITTWNTSFATVKSSGVIPLNQWFRLECHVLGAVSTGIIEAKIYNTPDSSTPTETVTVSSAATGGTIDTIFLGDSGNANVAFWADNVVADDAAYPSSGIALSGSASIAITTTAAITIAHTQILQTTSGSIPTSGTSFTVTFPSTTATTSMVVVCVDGNTVVSTPGGWSSRSPQVNWMGQYIFDHAGGSNNYAFTCSAGHLVWHALEIANSTFLTSAGQNATGGSVYTYDVPSITPPAGACVLIGSYSNQGTSAYPISSGWTNSYTKLLESGSQITSEWDEGLTTILETTANGSTAYTTSATFTESLAARSTIGAAYSTARSISVLTDSFTSLDLAKWDASYGSAYSIVSGQLKIDSGTGYPAVGAFNVNITNGSFGVQVFPTASLGNSLQTLINIVGGGTGNRVEMYTGDGSLWTRSSDNSVVDTQYLWPYDATAHAWWQIAESINGLSQKVVVPASTTQDIRLNPISITAGVPYTLSVYAWVTALNVSPTGVAVLKIEWLNSGGGLVNYDYTVIAATDSSFIRRTLTTTPGTGAVTGRIILAVENGGTVYWDDVQLEQAASVTNYVVGGVNLLTNTGFEVDSNADGLADNWGLYGTPTTTLDSSKRVGTFTFSASPDGVTWTPIRSVVHGWDPGSVTAYLMAGNWAAESAAAAYFDNVLCVVGGPVALVGQADLVLTSTGTAVETKAEVGQADLVLTSTGTAVETKAETGSVVVTTTVTATLTTVHTGALFWVGGTGNWEESVHWSATTGGSAGAPIPTSTNDVTFDTSSGTAFTCTITASANANSVTFNRASSTLLLNAGLTVVGAVTHTLGTINTNSQTCSWGSFVCNNSNTRVLTLGSSAITITGAGVSWTTQASTGLTITANTAVITSTGASFNLNSSSGTINYNGMSFIFNGSGAVSCGSSTGTWTVAAITRTGTAAAGDQLGFLSNTTITGNLTATGNSISPNRVLVFSNVLGTPMTVTVGGTVTSTNADWQDIAAAGAGNWTLSTATGGVGDCGGNSGFGVNAFTTPATQTCSSSTNVNWSAATWTSRVPLPQDNVLFSGSAVRTITIDVTRCGKDFDMSGATNLTLGPSSTLTTSFHGSFTMGSNSISAATLGWRLNGRGSHTLSNTGGNIVNPAVSISAGGTYTLATRWVQGSDFNVGIGTLNTNNFNIDVGRSFITTSATVNAGTSTITVGMISTTGTFTFNTAGSTIDISQATLVYAPGLVSTSSRTFTSNGKTIGALTYTTVNGSGTLVISGSNTFGMLTVGSGRTLTLTASTTNTVNNLVTSGVNNGYVRLSGASGAYISAPDSTALSITGDQEILVRASYDVVSASGSNLQIVSKYGSGAAGTLSWGLFFNNGGGIFYRDSITGAAASYNSTLATNGQVIAALTVGVTYWLRMTIDVDNGAGKREIKLYYAADNSSIPSSWTQLGTTVNFLAAGTLFDSTVPLEIGSFNAGAEQNKGNFKRVIILNGLAGTTAFDADFTTKTVGSNTFTESSANAATVTLNGQATLGDGRLEIISSTPGTKANLALPNGSITNDYLRLTDSAVTVGGAYAGPHSVLVSNNSGWGTTLKQLDGSLFITTVTTGAICEDFNVIGSADISVLTSGTESLVKSLIGSCAIATTVSDAAISRQVVLAGQANVTTIVNGLLNAVEQLVGQSDLTFTAIGTIGLNKLENAVISFNTTLTGLITQDTSLLGYLDIITDIVGTLGSHYALAGQANVTTTVNGLLGNAEQLAGNNDLIFTAIGTIGLSKLENAVISFDTTLTGFITQDTNALFLGHLDIITNIVGSLGHRHAVWLLRAEPVRSVSHVALQYNGALHYSAVMATGHTAVRIRTSGLLQSSRFLIPKGLIVSVEPYLVIDSVTADDTLQVETDFNPSLILELVPMPSDDRSLIVGSTVVLTALVSQPGSRNPADAALTLDHLQRKGATTAITLNTTTFVKIFIGTYELKFETVNYTPGVYLYRVRAQDEAGTALSEGTFVLQPLS